MTQLSLWALFGQAVQAKLGFSFFSFSLLALFASSLPNCLQEVKAI